MSQNGHDPPLDHNPEISPKRPFDERVPILLDGTPPPSSSARAECRCRLKSRRTLAFRCGAAPWPIGLLEFNFEKSKFMSIDVDHVVVHPRPSAVGHAGGQMRVARTFRFD
jgi:hypothetical protein